MAGVLGAGATLVQLGGLSSKADAKGGPTEKWPWPYKKLDPAKTAEIAYKEQPEELSANLRPCI